MISQYVKTADEIEAMRVAGRITAQTLSMIGQYVKKGVTTDELNEICHEFITKHDAIPAPLNYRGFPKSICTSPNYVVCHGIPNDKKLKDGDILNIDVSLSKDGFYGDSCLMFFIGKPSIMAQRLVQCAQEVIYHAIASVKPGVNLKEIGKLIQQYVEKKYNYSVVREFCGHGVGKSLHEDNFQVLHYFEPNSADLILEPGHTFTIEPMINAGKRHIKILADEWTVVTKDRSLSAQYEHTLLVTDTGFEILTLREGEAENFEKITGIKL